MRKDVDNRSENEKEIQEFLSHFGDESESAPLSTGLKPSEHTEGMGLEPSHHEKGMGLDPAEDISSTGLVSSQQNVRTGLEPSEHIEGTGLESSEYTAGTGLEPSEGIDNNSSEREEDKGLDGASDVIPGSTGLRRYNDTEKNDLPDSVSSDNNKAEQEEKAATDMASKKDKKSITTGSSKNAKASGKSKNKRQPIKDKVKKALAFCGSSGKPVRNRSFKGLFINTSTGKFSFVKLIRNLALLMLACLLMFSIYAFVVISMSPKIDPDNIYKTVAESSKVYDDSGKQIESVYYEQDRTIVKYKQMPKDLVNAFVALEDKTFWKHHGFNWTRMIGAIFQSFTGSGRVSGTSTVTQQLARNVYLPKIKSQRSIRRKIIEMYYASQIEGALTKEKIMEAYLNTIYLGFGNYGVEAAAKSYFSKDVSELNTQECAALAALPQAPDEYALIKLADSNNISDKTANIIIRQPETYIANDISKDRRDLCLDLMKEQGYITEQQRKDNYGKNLIEFIHPTVTTNAGVNSYFSEYLVDQVKHDLKKKYKMSSSEAERMIYTGGLRIYSTMDSTAQSVIVNEFNNSNNYPNLVGIRTDYDGNILTSGGSIMLYKYDNMFDGNGNMVLGSDECTINKNGSVTVNRGHRLNIYTTTSGGVTDYSLEFKHSYVREDRTLYTYAGGYINIPAKYKSLDENDNLLISKDFFKSSKDITISGDNLVIGLNAYTLPAKTVQPQSAMVIVEVGTGKVKAMVGGRMASGKKLYNRAINPRQPGSSLKPLAVYGAALSKSKDLADKGETWPFVDYKTDNQGANYGNYLTAGTTIIDQPQRIGGRNWPRNAGGGYNGNVTMRRALQLSLNVVAVKIQLQVGNEYSAELVKKFGITTLDTDGATSDMNPAALALGGLTNGVKPIEMAQAFAAFPNGGVRQDSIAYTKVVDRSGKTILNAKSKSHKVLDEGVAWIMTDMLKSVVSNGIGSAARLSGVQSGGKTGTTSETFDIWFDGFTPSYAAALWIGSDVNIPLATSSALAARLWSRIMNQIPAALQGSYKSMPSSVVRYGGEYYSDGTQKGLYYKPPGPTKEELEAKRRAEEAQKAAEAAQQSATPNQATP